MATPYRKLTYIEPHPLGLPDPTWKKLLLVGDPPTAHKTSHEDGGADEISLEGLLGQPYNLPPFFDRWLDEWWKTMDGWTQNTAGTGTDSNELMKLTMKTDITINSRDSRYTGNITGHPHASGRRFLTRFQLATLPADCEIRFYLVKNTATMAPLSDTEEHGGFKLINGDLYASNADGTTETATDTEVDWEHYNVKTLEIRGTGSAIEFYVDNVLKATHDTNLPSSYGYCVVLEIKNTAAANKEIALYFVRGT